MTRLRLIAPGNLSSPRGPLSALLLAVLLAGTAAAQNSAPVARAGPDRVAARTAFVQLDGRGSADPDGNPLTYGWSQLSGPAVVGISSPSSSVAGFSTGTTGTYSFQLSISDGQGGNASDTVSVEIRTAPVGADLIVRSVSLSTLATPTGHPVRATAAVRNAGTSPVLDPFVVDFVLSQDDAVSTGLSILGQSAEVSFLASGAEVAVEVATLAVPGGVAAGSYFVGAIVSPSVPIGELSEINNRTASALRLAVTTNAPPSAAAAVIETPPFIITDRVPITLTLDANGSSDSDGDLVSYRWSKLSGPGVGLTTPTSFRTRFTTAQPGVYVFQVVVEDGFSGQASAQVTATLTPNSSPVPGVAPSQLLTSTDGAPVRVELDARGATDPDEDPLTYRWFQNGVPPVTLQDAGTPLASFVTPRTTSFSFTVEISDGKGGVSRATQIVDIVLNFSPTASAGPTQRVTSTDRSPLTVRLDASASADPDGDPLAYTWTQIEGELVSLSSSRIPTPTFVTDTAGTYGFRVTVDDGRGGLATASTSVIVDPNLSPVANAGPDQSVAATLGQAIVVTLDGSTSFDLDGDPLLYSWVQTAGTTVTLFGADRARPTFQATGPGTFDFRLSVSDGRSGASSDTVRVTARFPDLAPQAATFPTTAGAGTSFGGSVTARNPSATGLEAPFDVGVFLSRDDRLGPEDARVATATIPRLDAGQSASAAYTASVSLPFPPGSYSVLVQTDPSEQIFEESESNNLIAAPGSLRVLSPPDLVVASVFATGSARIGKPTTFSAIVRNDGEQAVTQPIEVSAFLTDSAAAPSRIVFFGTLTLPPLAAGASTSFTTAFPIPLDSPIGAAFVRLVADPLARIALELKRDNNENVSATPIFVDRLPDLRVRELTAPATLAPGTPFPLQLTVENIGGAEAPAPFTYWYFLSTDRDPATTGTFLGAIFGRDPIPAGGSAVFADSRTIPRVVPPGPYFVEVVLDPLDELTEEDESNNAGVTAVSSRVATAAFLVLAEAALPAQLPIGQPFSIATTTSNLGNGASAGFELAAWRSADALLDAGDLRLSSLTRSGLASGASASIALTGTVDPRLVSEGDAFLLVALVSADATTQTAEGPPGNLRARQVRFVDQGLAPEVTLSYSRTSPVSAGELTVVATFTEPLVAPPTLAIDLPGTADLAPVPMSGSGKLFTFSIAVRAQDGGANRDGEALVTVTGGRDADGNENLPASNARFRIDTRGPVFTELLPASEAISPGSGTLTGRLLDDSAIRTATLSVNGGAKRPLTLLSGSGFQVAYSLTGDANDLALAAADAAGNVSGTTLRVFLDEDGDGMSNIYERQNGLDPLNPGDRDADPDGDGLGNFVESTLGTNPRVADSDADGVNDGEEVALGTDPLGRENAPPVARAGVDRSQGPGLVVLDGSASSDPERRLVQYAWEQTAGPAVTLSGATLPNPQFVGRTAGQYDFRLTVRDPDGASASDDVRVVIGNRPPRADAGFERVGALGALVRLDGTRSSDPNGDLLVYEWTEAPGNPATRVLDDARLASPGFVPPVAGAYLFSLRVIDSAAAESAQTTVRVVAIDPASGVGAPNADAGPDRTVTLGQQAVLDGRESTDADSTAPVLTYRWQAISLPGGVERVELSDAETARPSFVPVAAGVYAFRLVVRDDLDDALESAPDETLVLVNDPGNRVPWADAGPDQQVTLGQVTMLNGSGSRDTDLNLLTYAWTQVGGPETPLPVTTGAIVPVSPALPGDYTFGLVVSDGVSSSPMDTVLVRVSPDGRNGAPRAVARVLGLDASRGVRVRVPDGGTLTVELDGSGSSDPDGDALRYSWRQIAGPVVALGDALSAQASFTPQVSRVYAFELEVTDAIFRSRGLAQVIVDTAGNTVPTARVASSASGTLTTAPGASVTLDGSASDDAEAGVLEFLWVQTSGPFLDFFGQGTTRLTVTPRLAGSYGFTLFVDDGADRSVGEPVELIVSSSPATPGDGGDDAGGGDDASGSSGSGDSDEGGGGSAFGCDAGRAGTASPADAAILLLAAVAIFATRRVTDRCRAASRGSPGGRPCPPALRRR